MDDEHIMDSVKDYYGKILKSKSDLQTTTCCPLDKISVPPDVLQAMKLIHKDVADKYYGCGLVIPSKLKNMKILDLGSGSGHDCYVLSKLVGASGEVHGIDMTEEQLNTARQHVDYHTKAFGFEKSNVHFVHGYIERLTEANLKPNYFDIIISNCVINLSPDKKAVLKEAYTCLKEGGEMYFSDVYADRELSQEIRQHEVLWGECLAGALSWNELMKLARNVGFTPPQVVSSRFIETTKKEFQEVLGDVKFVSVTCRLFKLPSERQKPTVVSYKGTVLNNEQELPFANASKFVKGEAVLVDGYLSTILKSSRYCEDFVWHDTDEGEAKALALTNIDPFVLAASKSSSSCCTPQGGCC